MLIRDDIHYVYVTSVICTLIYYMYMYSLILLLLIICCIHVVNVK